MRRCTAVHLFTWLIVSCFCTVARAQAPDNPAAKALRFFEALPTRNPGAVLRLLRPPHAGADERARALAILPESGELRPDRRERAKLATFEDVLAYHERAQVFETKVIDVPQAVVALHQRTVLLISRPALRLLSGAELQALVAHEIGHDYFWGEFERTLALGDRKRRQELELKCDGIAVLTLVALRLDLGRLVDGLHKQLRFNETLGANANAPDYPQIQERQRFITALSISWSSVRMNPGEVVPHAGWGVLTWNPRQPPSHDDIKLPVTQTPLAMRVVGYAAGLGSAAARDRLTSR